MGNFVQTSKIVLNLKQRMLLKKQRKGGDGKKMEDGASSTRIVTYLQLARWPGWY